MVSWNLPRDESLDHLLKKYGGGGDVINRVNDGYFESAITGIYARAKGKAGFSKDIAKLIETVPAKEITIGSLNLAIKKNDAATRDLILDKIPTGEIIKYSDSDRDVIAMRNRRILSKYTEDNKEIRGSAEMSFGDMLKHIYTGAKKSGLGLKVAAPDVATLVSVLPAKSPELTLAVLQTASTHGDTANAILIAGKMPINELVRYAGKDKAIIPIRDSRAAKEVVEGAVQNEDLATKSKSRGKQTTVPSGIA